MRSCRRDLLLPAALVVNCNTPVLSCRERGKEEQPCKARSARGFAVRPYLFAARGGVKIRKFHPKRGVNEP